LEQAWSRKKSEEKRKKDLEDKKKALIFAAAFGTREAGPEGQREFIEKNVKREGQHELARRQSGPEPIPEEIQEFIYNEEFDPGSG
jgi:hypothetical protein